jgi:hypothetical protein
VEISTIVFLFRLGENPTILQLQPRSRRSTTPRVATLAFTATLMRRDDLTPGPLAKAPPLPLSLLLSFPPPAITSRGLSKHLWRARRRLLRPGHSEWRGRQQQAFIFKWFPFSCSPRGRLTNMVGSELRRKDLDIYTSLNRWIGRAAKSSPRALFPSGLTVLGQRSRCCRLCSRERSSGSSDNQIP